LAVFQSPQDFAPADLSFLKDRPLPRFSEITRVVPPATPADEATFLADDFESATLNTKLWTATTGNAELQDGTLRLAQGSAVTASLADHTDVVAVSEVTLASAESIAAVQMVGGPHGPAYHATVVVRGDGTAALEYLTEPARDDADWPGASVADPQTLRLEPGPARTFTIKIQRADDSSMASCFVKGNGGWQQVGTAHAIPMLDANLVLQARAGSVRFDNVRAYPRPEVSYAFFRVGADLSQDERAKYEGDPLHREIVVEVYDEDGSRLAGRARGYHGSTHVPLDSDVLDTYPAPALVKIFCLDEQVGQPVKLPAQGIHGLYPGSLWHVTIK
jgi:hypothetical protein